MALRKASSFPCVMLCSRNIGSVSSSRSSSSSSRGCHCYSLPARCPVSCAVLYSSCTPLPEDRTNRQHSFSASLGPGRLGCPCVSRCSNSNSNRNWHSCVYCRLILGLFLVLLNYSASTHQPHMSNSSSSSSSSSSLAVSDRRGACWQRFCALLGAYHHELSRSSNCSNRRGTQALQHVPCLVLLCPLMFNTVWASLLQEISSCHTCS